MKRLSMLLILLNGTLAQRVYNLTQNAPSYAIHSNRLRLNQPIRVNSCENCTLLIDASCWGFNGYVPFFLNGASPDLRQCVDDDTKKLSFTKCYYEVQGSVLLQYNAIANGNEFALSVRVKEWLEDGSDYTLYPVQQNSSLTIGSVITFSPTVVTIVARMATNPITLISYIGMAQANCTTTILAGGVPGKTLNQAFILDAIGKDDRFMDSIIRSSVFTVYVPAGCRADIKFGDRDQAYTTFDGLRDQGRAIISSFEYPWEFDDTTKYEAEVIGEYRMDNNATMLNITFHISEIVGGLLSIYVPNFDPNGRLVSSSNMTFDTLKNGSISGPQGQVVQYKWMPKKNQSIKGFRMVMRAENPWNFTTITSETVTSPLTSSPTAVFQSTTTKNAISLQFFTKLLFFVLFFNIMNL